MAKVELTQERVYVPGEAKKRGRIALFFLVVFMAASLWALAREGVFKNGMEELSEARQAYMNKAEAVK